MSECYHKLCHAHAVEAVDVGDSRLGGVFAAPVDDKRRHYELCVEHFARYFPRGVGYMHRRDAVALRIQCSAQEPPEPPLPDAPAEQPEASSRGRCV